MKDFVVGALVGAFIGGTIVALTTPKSGPELVDGLNHMAHDEMKKMKAKHPAYYDRLMAHHNAMKHTGECHCHSRYCTCHTCTTKSCDHEDCCCHSKYCTCGECGAEKEA